MCDMEAKPRIIRVYPMIFYLVYKLMPFGPFLVLKLTSGPFEECRTVMQGHGSGNWSLHQGKVTVSGQMWIKIRCSVQWGCGSI